MKDVVFYSPEYVFEAALAAGFLSRYEASERWIELWMYMGSWEVDGKLSHAFKHKVYRSYVHMPIDNEGIASAHPHILVNLESGQ